MCNKQTGNYCDIFAPTTMITFRAILVCRLEYSKDKAMIHPPNKNRMESCK